jgi:hypothetical protein
MSVGLTKVRVHLGSIALGVSIVEPVVIWGVAIFVLHNTGHDWSWTTKPLLLVYLVGVASIPLAIVALLSGPRRWLACVALVLGAINFVICGIPLIQ